MKKRLIVIAGRSGSGLSTGVKNLEDRGYYAIDNLPIDLIFATAELLQKGEYKDSPGFAFGVHVRRTLSAAEIEASTARLRESFNFDLIFLEASPEVITHRYGASRRPHPLSTNGFDLAACIVLESEHLAHLKKSADLVIDTSDLSPYVLAKILEARYLATDKRSLLVLIQSFGFKHGQLDPAEGIFDVRFLPNPFFVKDLSHKSGNEPDVRKWLEKDPRFLETLKRLEDWHRWILPQFLEDGRTYYRVGIGCTGGRHRSVAMASALFEKLSAEGGLKQIHMTLQHRDILKV
jgi:UPF0042 nucleotide-binding protein